MTLPCPELKFSEFKDTASRFMCPNCPIGQRGCMECEDVCIECYLEYRAERAKIRGVKPDGRTTDQGLTQADSPDKNI